MEINKTYKWLYILTAVWVVLLLSLGSWWLYLVFKLHQMISVINENQLISETKFLNMLRWEGSFFLFLLISLGLSLFYIYFKDLKKTKAIQAFFASLSHELKTPLSSMRLQAEVIRDLLNENMFSKDKVSELAQRLIHDTQRFETELENSLQLARVEQDGVVHLIEINWPKLFQKTFNKLSPNRQLNLNYEPSSEEILGDESALEVIFKNLIENSLRHNPEGSVLSLKGTLQKNKVHIKYTDHGEGFKGEISKLATLFYKSNSSQGTGIGLYLIKMLLHKMNGHLAISRDEKSLVFTLELLKAKGLDEEA